MDKITPLEEVQFLRAYEINEDHRTLDDSYFTRIPLDNIEKALKDYVSLQNKYDELETEYLDQQRSMLKYDEVKQKKFRVFKIIKEKEVNVHNFKKFIINQNWSYKAYLSTETNQDISAHFFSYKLLTQEEFETLKEELLCQQ